MSKTCYKQYIMCIVILGSMLLATLGQAKSIGCLKIVRTTYSETIFNRCNVCRIGTIIRSRPGNAVPSSRTYNVQPKTKITVPFKGPGASRITRDSPCERTPGGPVNLLGEPPKPSPEKCLKLINEDGRFQLINNCSTCRKGGILRTNKSGKRRDFIGYKIAGNQKQPIQPNGFSQAKLLIDIQCK